MRDAQEMDLVEEYFPQAPEPRRKIGQEPTGYKFQLYKAWTRRVPNISIEVEEDRQPYLKRIFRRIDWRND